MSCPENYHFCFTEGETEAQRIQGTFLKALCSKQKIPPLTPDPGDPGRTALHLKDQTQ
jgi:hypothetical protein